MTDDFIDEDTGGDIIPAESQEMKKPRRGRVATAECPDCHYRFPKPEMHEYTEYVETGRSSGVSIGSPNKRGRMNPRISSRTYKRKKTVWVCSECNKKRLANKGTGCFGSATTIILVFSFMVVIALVSLS